MRPAWLDVSTLDALEREHRAGVAQGMETERARLRARDRAAELLPDRSLAETDLASRWAAGEIAPAVSGPLEPAPRAGGLR